jgi:hypothetical protein
MLYVITSDEYGYEHVGSETHIGHLARECNEARTLRYRQDAPSHMLKLDEFGYPHLISNGRHVGHNAVECQKARELGYRPQRQIPTKSSTSCDLPIFWILYKCRV